MKNRKLAATTACLIGVACVAGSQTARAGTQSTDLFRRTAKNMVVRIAVNRMKSVCKGAKHAALCKDFVGMMAGFVSEAIDGEFDAPTVVARFRTFASRSMAAMAVDRMRGWLHDTIYKDLSTLSSSSEAQSVLSTAERALDCLVRNLVAADTSVEPCVNVPSSLHSERLNQCLSETRDSVKAICVSRVMFLKLIDQYPAAQHTSDDLKHKIELVTRLLERVVNSLDGDAEIFDAVSNALLAFQDMESFVIGSFGSHRVFSEVPDPRAPNAEAYPADPSCRELSKQMEQFFANARQSYFEYARAVVRGDLDAVPERLRVPDFTECRDASAAFLQWRSYAEGFVFETKLLAQVRRVEFSVVLAAALIDYIRTSDDAAARDAALYIVLYAIRHQIAGGATRSHECTKVSDHYDCEEFSGDSHSGNRFVVTAPNDELVNEYVESRHGFVAADRNCFVQLVAGIVGDQSFHASAAGQAYCWLDDSMGPRSADWSDYFQDTLALLGIPDAATQQKDFVSKTRSGAGGPVAIWKWDPRYTTEAIPAVAPLVEGQVFLRLRLPARITINRALALAAKILDARGPGEVVQAAALARRVLVEMDTGDHKAVLRALLSAAAVHLRPYVNEFVAKLLGAECGADDTSARCAVRAVALAFYEPLTQVIAGTATDRDFVVKMARKLDKLDALDSSFFLFEIGPAYTAIRASGDDQWSQHFTVLDKWGLAYKWGEERRGQLGVFVGGFIDAIIRSASHEEEDDGRWLFGVTLGYREFDALPVGISAHAAWAPPVDFRNDANAWALGASIMVPLDEVLTD